MVVQLSRVRSVLADGVGVGVGVGVGAGVGLGVGVGAGEGVGVGVGDGVGVLVIVVQLAGVAATNSTRTVGLLLKVRNVTSKQVDEPLICSAVMVNVPVPASKLAVAA